MEEINQKISHLKGLLKNTRKIGNEKDIAVVCCYFNPMRYRSKLRNYNTFRMNLLKKDIKLLTVELTFGNGPPELDTYPNVLKIKGGKKSIMWQKERLLNLGIKRLLKEGYKKIIWVDIDIIFETDDWVDKISETLDKYPICQIYSKVNRDNPLNGLNSKPSSMKYYSETGILSESKATPGGGWAARAEILKKINLYDAAILGGGDTLFLFGCFYYKDKDIKKIEDYSLLKRIDKKYVKHYLSWAKQMGSISKGNVGFVNLEITTLYHGSNENRKYTERHDILRKHKFNPRKDLKLSKEGCWEWSSKKRNLHLEVAKYFSERREDD